MISRESSLGDELLSRTPPEHGRFRQFPESSRLSLSSADELLNREQLKGNHKMATTRPTGGPPAAKLDAGSPISVDDIHEMRNVFRKRRLAANSRERKRMRRVNAAFDRLRSVLPAISDDRKLSKRDTLQMAKTYIAVLLDVLKNDISDEN